MTEEQMDIVFHALSHATRRQILDRLKAHPGQAVGQLASQFDVSRIAVMNHLSVLERAGLIISKRDGRTRQLWLNAAPIQLVRDRWIDSYDAPFAERIAGIKRAAEAAARKGGKKA